MRRNQQCRAAGVIDPQHAMNTPRTMLRGTLLALAIGLASTPALCDGWFDRFTDPRDGQLDLSEWLLDHRGFLPVPIIITEPAIGYGGGLALAFFTESLRDAAKKAGDSGHMTPPDIFAVGAAATDNGTRGAAAGGQWTFLDDRFRYRGGIAKMQLNLDFYGIGGQLPVPAPKIGYSLEGIASFQQAMMRLGASNTFVGLRWIYLDLEPSLDTPIGDAGLLPRQMAQTSSGLGLTLEHDSRDNIFTPNSGWLGELATTFYDQRFGSDNDFQAYRAHAFHYTPLRDDLTLGLRGDVRLARGDVPFYQLPFIDLRGIPAARFQDSNVTVVEAELRYDFDVRWSVVVFAGSGRAWGERVGFSDADKPWSGGFGLRYLIARRLGLYVGVDVARSTVDQAFYIQVGNAWR